MEATRQTASVELALVDDRPLVALGVERLVASCRARLTLAWVATSPADARTRMLAAAPDVILIAARFAASLSGEEQRLFAPSSLLVLLDVPNPELQDRAVLAGARGFVTLADRSELFVRAIETLASGELWLDRATTGRLVGNLSRPSQPAPKEVAVEQLTDREKHILQAVIASVSLGARDIASTLGISESTLRNHLTSIYGKLGVSGRVELHAFAHRHGLARAV